MVKEWLGLHDFSPAEWHTFNDARSWWDHILHAHPGRKKALASLLMLVSWEIWNERNRRVFKNSSTLPSIILDRIKHDAHDWVLAGAKQLGHLLLGG